MRVDRNHWSLFPVVFEGRSLPLSVYDELMGILAHGCIGEPMNMKSEFDHGIDQHGHVRCDDFEVIDSTIR